MFVSSPIHIHKNVNLFARFLIDCDSLSLSSLYYLGLSTAVLIETFVGCTGVFGAV